MFKENSLFAKQYEERDSEILPILKELKLSELGDAWQMLLNCRKYILAKNFNPKEKKDSLFLLMLKFFI